MINDTGYFDRQYLEALITDTILTLQENQSQLPNINHFGDLNKIDMYVYLWGAVRPLTNVCLM